MLSFNLCPNFLLHHFNSSAKAVLCTRDLSCCIFFILHPFILTSDPHTKYLVRKKFNYLSKFMFCEALLNRLCSMVFGVEFFHSDILF